VDRLTRPRILIGVAVVLAVGVGAFLLFGRGSTSGLPPELAQIEKLREKGDITAVAARVADPSEEVARYAVGALARLGSASAPEIRRAMEDPRPRVREQAATSFAQVSRYPEAAPLAKMAREDPSADVRAAAVSGLNRMGAFGEMDTFLAAMDDPDPIVRRRAGEAAKRFACADVRFRADDPPEKRQAAIQTLRDLWQKEKDLACKRWPIILAEQEKHR